MLKVTRRGRLEGLRDLSAHEERGLRDALGRWPEPGARAADAALGVVAAVPGLLRRLGTHTGR